MNVVDTKSIDVVDKKCLCIACDIKLYPVKYHDDKDSLVLGLLRVKTFDEAKQKFHYYSYCERCFTLYQHQS